MNTIPVDKLAQKAYMVKFIDAIEKSFWLGVQIFDRYPETVKSRLNQDITGYSDELNESTIQELALAFSRLPTGAKSNIVERLGALRCYIYNDCIDVINDEELLLLSNMLAFFQKLGSSSRRALESAISDAVDGYEGYIVIKYDGRNSEVIRRQTLFPGGNEWTTWGKINN